eukprot:403367576
MKQQVGSTNSDVKNFIYQKQQFPASFPPVIYQNQTQQAQVRPYPNDSQHQFDNSLQYQNDQKYQANIQSQALGGGLFPHQQKLYSQHSVNTSQNQMPHYTQLKLENFPAFNQQSRKPFSETETCSFNTQHQNLVQNYPYNFNGQVQVSQVGTNQYQQSFGSQNISSNLQLNSQTFYPNFQQQRQNQMAHPQKSNQKYAQNYQKNPDQQKHNHKKVNNNQRIQNLKSEAPNYEFDKNKVKKSNINLELKDLQVDVLAKEIFQTSETKEFMKQKKIKKSQRIQNHAPNPERIVHGIEKVQVSHEPIQTIESQNNKFDNNLVATSLTRRDNFDKEKGSFKFSEWDFPLDLTQIQAQSSVKEKQQTKPQVQPMKKQKQVVVQKEIKQNNSTQHSIVKAQDKQMLDEAQVQAKQQSHSSSAKPKLDQDKKEELKQTEQAQNQDIQEDSEYMKMWKSIPKNKRERLTKKQIQRIDKPDLLAESLSVQVEERVKDKKLVIPQNPDSNYASSANQSKSKAQSSLQSNKGNLTFATPAQESINQSFSMNSRLDDVNEQSGVKRSYVQKASGSNQYNQQRSKFNDANQSAFGKDKVKSKPKKIVVEERNENNEIVRQIIEKAKKRKITALKKAILRKRELKDFRDKDKIKIEKKAKRQQQLEKENNEGELSSGYVTIDENAVEEIGNKQVVQEGIKTRGFPYLPLFKDLDQFGEQIENDLCRKFQPEKSIYADQEIKFKVFNSQVTQEQFYQLHPKKSIREYVDVIQSDELDTCLTTLIQKLKKLYFNRKSNPNKKGKVTRNVKKRYIVGIKEIMKHLAAENLKMVILAINLERVDGEHGLDDFIYQIIQKSRELKVPLIFAMTRYKLGFVSKFQGQMASAIGIFNFQGANEEFNQLVLKSKVMRHDFYKQLARNVQDYEAILLRKENRFLDWTYFDQVKNEKTTFFD